MKSKEGKDIKSNCILQHTLIAYLSGKLSGLEMNAVERHLSGCAMCADELEGLSKLTDPNDIHSIEAKINNAIDGYKPRTSNHPFIFQQYLKIAAAVILLIGASTIIYYTTKLYPTTPTISEAIIAEEGIIPFEEEIIAEQPISLSKEEIPATRMEEITQPDEPAKLGNASEHPIIPAEGTARRKSQSSPPPPQPAQVNDIISVTENDLDVFETNEFFDNEELAEETTYKIAVFDDGELEELEGEEIFVVAEEMPRFNNGGIEEFNKYIKKNLKYPETAAESGIQGKVFVNFVIDVDGSVTDVKIAHGVDSILDKEALRVIKSSPKWEPGMQRGKAVRVSYTVPVVFALQ